MSAAGEIRLDGEGVLGALGLAAGDGIGGGLSVDAAFPHHEGGVLVSFRRAGTRRTIGLQIRRRDDRLPAWRRTRHLDVVTQIPAGEDEAAALAVFSPLVGRLEDADGPETLVVAPTLGDAPPAALPVDLPPGFETEAPSPFSFGRVFVLDLASDCAQRCSFCSTRRKMSPEDTFDAAGRERLLGALERARALGYDVLRLSGLDPLAHPDVVAAAARARDLGFRHVHVYSPSTRLADAAFLDALLDAMPPSFTFHVPLYGASAEVHDAVTGRPGSFDLVLAALSLLAARDLAPRVVFAVVPTRRNQDDLPAVRAFARRFGAPVQVYLPFPSTRDPKDAFFEVSVRHEALLPALLACDPPIGLSEILPCVRYRHERATGEPSLRTGGFHPTAALMGTLFASAAYLRMGDLAAAGAAGETPFTVPLRACPHAAACALASVCPRAVYAAYADLHGTAEMRPVSRWELWSLRRP